MSEEQDLLFVPHPTENWGMVVRKRQLSAGDPKLEQEEILLVALHQLVTTQAAALAAKDAEIVRVTAELEQLRRIQTIHYAGALPEKGAKIVELAEKLAASEAEKAKLREQVIDLHKKLERASIIGLEKIESIALLTAQLEEAKRMRPTHGDIKLLEQKLADAEKARDAATKRNSELTSQVEAMQKHIDELNNQILEPSTPPAP